MKILWSILILLSSLNLLGNGISMVMTDTLDVITERKDPKLFYDSLQIKASRHHSTQLLYDWMIRKPKVIVDIETLSYEYYHSFENKTIASITIKSLEVFGPDFNDTSKTTGIWIEKAANKLHTKSNLSVIRKNLWIKEGQALDANLIMDNERLLRSLPYLKDVRIIITPRPTNNDLVDITVLTKDVFSFGALGSIGNINQGELGIYDKNILGIGHEVGTKLVVSTNKSPSVGYEAYYTVNNFKGNFINFTAGYANTFLRKGYYLSLQRDFLRPKSVYAGGLTVFRSFKSFNVNLNDLVTTEFPLSYIYLDAWYGRRLKHRINPTDDRFQVNLSGRIKYESFFERPAPDIHNNQYFANSTFYLASLSFSQRSYVRDHLVYSYGITEDIPKGYLNELVFGYDQNEFGDRWYSHLFFSTGNLFRNKPFYFYTSFGLGSFWNSAGFEQGMTEYKLNFISPLFMFMNVQARQFIKLNYTMGINRFEIEDLWLKNGEGIRGFGSIIGKGKQRLTLNIENVFFQNRAILNFQTALFTFLDLGLIGSADKSIFTQDYYGGLGIGLRIRNENLVFNTIQIRLAFYPYHPSDVNSMGFLFEGVTKTNFYSFQPKEPGPLRFE